ncbi:Protein kinase domain [Sesbania bispinosa]|nr:Protein kinase domain [Sesbania bispinosa]
MKPISLVLPAFRSMYLYLLLFTLNSLWLDPNITTASASGNESDLLALLKFKESITSDPYEILRTWNGSTHFCKWRGITCNPMHQRVGELNLQGYQLQGSISPHVGNLSLLRNLNLGNNSFHGKIPQELGGVTPFIGNLSFLTGLLVGYNNLEGNIPQEICCLKNLTTISANVNKLSGTFPSCLYNTSSLIVISTSNNEFNGSLPPNMFHTLPSLQVFEVGNNQISGPIPTSISNASALQILGISLNQFVGQVPSMGKLKDLWSLHVGGNNLGGNSNKDLEFIKPLTNCSKLYILDIDSNNFGGSLPNSLSNLSTHLSLLYLGAQNMLEGNIPPSIGNCQKLQYLNLWQNNLRGNIPLEVFNISSLTSLLNLAQNRLSGNLPSEVGQLKSNFFHGTIPPSLASLKGLLRLDLSRNRLSGSIPKDLQNISFLEYFNVSFNMLGGEVPTGGVFRNASELAVTGNNKLCGGITELHLPPCPDKGMKPAKHHNFRLIAVIVSVVAFLLILLCILTIYWMRKKNKKPSSDSPTIDKLAKVSYQNLHNGTDGFSARNLIGSGNFGTVYKGTLESEDRVVAIKVLTSCSSTDYKGQEFKALVFEYMNNGSLESWLHPTTENTDQSKSLTLEQSNVLLDDCMVAHVSDFGLARLLPSVGVSLKQSSTIGIKGTIGYAPPEYGMGSEMSIEGDMYSFGILALEMLTGRRPTDEMFGDGHNLHNYVKLSISNNILQIVDPAILHHGLDVASESEDLSIMHPKIEKCLLSLFSIALACSVVSPKERMSMVDVTRELNKIKTFFLTGV